MKHTIKLISVSIGLALAACGTEDTVEDLDPAGTNGDEQWHDEGPLLLGWDRLFVPDDEDATLAQLTAAGEVTEFRRAAYTSVARMLGLA